MTRTPTLVRLRPEAADAVSLPWRTPLAEWDATEVPLRDLPVGTSRHLVRFVEVGSALVALKELPLRLARREYEVLRLLEDQSLPAVRPLGLVEYVEEDSAVLVTAYLERSWQYRRLFLQLPLASKHRERLLDGMASLLVDLHRHGVYWGDCSLANTLFTRDGQLIRAHLVDAETSEVHPQLTRGQREYDLEILLENVAAGLMDVAAHLELDEEASDELFSAAFAVRTRYDELWTALHEERTVSLAEPAQTTSALSDLNALGFSVSEVRLEPAGDPDQMRVHLDVSTRTHHAEELFALTGIQVGEGQARILLGDVHSYISRRTGDPHLLARRWIEEILTPGMHSAASSLGEHTDAVQAYCDLLEVRWLLSEEAGKDVGTDVALRALHERSLPEDAAAQGAWVEMPSERGSE